MNEGEGGVGGDTSRQYPRVRERPDVEGHAVRRPYGHCIAITRGTGEDGDGDRDRLRGVRVHCLGGQTGTTAFLY